MKNMGCKGRGRVISAYFFLWFLSGILHAQIEYYSDSLSITHMCQLVFDHLYEFNYPCSPKDSSLACKKEAFDLDMPLCGDAIMSGVFFEKLLQTTIHVIGNELNSSSMKWVKEQSLQRSFLMHEGVYPHGIATVFPLGTKIISMGDYHGNVHSLARNIRRLQHLGFMSPEGVLCEDIVLVMLGDIGDRGHYSLETWALAMLLKIKNPRQVILMQGNHETAFLFGEYGFRCELLSKFGENFEVIIESLLQKLFCLLPQVCFLGVQDLSGHVYFNQFNHGGLGQHGKLPDLQDMRVLPLLKLATQEVIFGNLYGMVYEGFSTDSGFIWNDFIATPGDKPEMRLQGWRHEEHLVHHGKVVVNYFRKLSEKYNFTVCGIIRGHAHLPGGINQLRYYAERKPFGSWMSNWTPLAKGANIPITFISPEFGFPVFTITSVCDVFHDEAFALLSFDQKQRLWFLENYRFDGPKESFSDMNYRWKTGVDDMLHATSEDVLFVPYGFSSDLYSSSYEDLTTYNR